MNNYFTLELPDPFTFAGEYFGFGVLEAEHEMEEPWLSVTFDSRNCNWDDDLLFYKILHLKERIDYVKNALNVKKIFPIYKMIYCPFINCACDESERLEELVLFLSFALEKNGKPITYEQLSELFPEETYNPCISKFGNIPAEIICSYNSYIPSSLKINFDKTTYEEDLIKLFNYLFFVHTKKTVYEELLENSFMEDGWFPKFPKKFEDVWDINSVKGSAKLKVNTLKRLHRQTLTHLDYAMLKVLER